MFRKSNYSLENDKEFNMSQIYQETVQIAILGMSQVGKSTIINCIENEQFRQDIASTKGFQLRHKLIRISRYKISLYLWDGAGDRILQFIHKGEFNKMDGILYVFDLSNLQSIVILDQLHEEMKKKQKNNELISLLIGNKSDLLMNNCTKSQEINYLAQKFALRNNLLYIKVSAKQNNFITDSFVEIIKQILIKKKQIRPYLLQQDLQKNISIEKQNYYCIDCKECYLI